MLYPFFPRHFRLSSRNQVENTTLLVKETSLETIESQTQQDLLYKDLENYADARRNDPARTMLAEVAEAAMMQAEAETQPDDPAMAVGNVTETDGVPVGQISKKIAVEAGGSGMRPGSLNRIEDHENTAIEDRFSSGEMMVLQEVSVLISTYVKEWQYKDILNDIDNLAWDYLSDVKLGSL